MILGIFTDRDTPTKMIETYTFSISYSDVGPHINLETGANGDRPGGRRKATKKPLSAASISIIDKDDTKRSIVLMMRKLALFLQTVPVPCQPLFSTMPSATDLPA